MDVAEQWRRMRLKCTQPLAQAKSAVKLGLFRGVLPPPVPGGGAAAGCPEWSQPGGQRDRLIKMNTLRKVIAAVVIAAGTGLYAQNPPAETESADKPGGMEKAVTAEPVDPKTYVIGAEDILLVRVWKEPELSGPVAVRPDGKFSLPLVGEQQAAGMTPAQVAENLTTALLEYLKRPQVDIAIQQVRSKKFYVTGEVMKPGSFALVVPTTVMQALTEAGGFKEFANKKKVTILRGSERLYFNYSDYVKGKDLDANILLEPGDEIVVP